MRNPSETARQFPPHAKNPFCIKISCPRIVDRPSDPFLDPPNSTIGSSARPPPFCRTSAPSWGPRRSIQPVKDRSSGLSGRPGQVIRRSRAVRIFGRAQISSDLSLQSCLASSSCKQSFQNPVPARHRVSVWKYIII